MSVDDFRWSDYSEHQTSLYAGYRPKKRNLYLDVRGQVEYRVCTNRHRTVAVFYTAEEAKNYMRIFAKNPNERAKDHG